jgi:hypothetical protein
MGTMPGTRRWALQEYKTQRPLKMAVSLFKSQSAMEFSDYSIIIEASSAYQGKT